MNGVFIGGGGHAGKLGVLILIMGFEITRYRLLPQCK